ncbi:MAG: hypothetical protein FJ108_06690 [Deltaproteobacteria bacterium]|nr:hypothetical protein [Deltaproteobacteria bacterium]
MPRRLLAVLASTVLLPACANHVRYTGDAYRTSERDVVHAETVVEPQSVPLATPEVELALLADETAVVRKLRTRIRIEESTPYKSGYELWEVPLGTVCVPVLLVLRVVDLVGFGILPDASLDAFAGFTFSAMNPLLNVESESRVRRKEVSRETEELDREVRRELRPLAGAKLVLTLDATAPQTRTSDARGRVRVGLLELVPDRLPGRPRLLRLSIEGEGERERQTLELPISHSLASRLVRALELRSQLRAPGATPEAIGRTLLELDGLGFSAAALSLETELRARESANPVWLARLDSTLLH